MYPKDLVVFLEEGLAYTRRIAIAAEIAARWQAHLIAIFAARPIGTMLYEDAAVGPALRSLLQQHQREVRGAEAEARRYFEQITSARGISCEWRFSEHETPEDLMLHARYARLAVIPPYKGFPEASMPVRVAENVIFGSGRPTLLIPDDWPVDRIGNRIVVGWNASREATRAIVDALPFLADAQAVKVVCVHGPAGLGEYEEDYGVDLCRHLARHGINVELEQATQGKPSQVLLRQVQDTQADLLVMGVYGHARLTRLILGGTSRTVLTHAQIPLLVSR